MIERARLCWFDGAGLRYRLTLAAFGFLTLFHGVANAQEDQAAIERLRQVYQSIRWQKGPVLATIADVAEIQVPAGYQFAGREGAAAWWEANGDPPDPTKVGVITPVDFSGWSLFFTYAPNGRVSDDEKHELVSHQDELLRSIRDATARDNVYRRSKGFPEYSVTGWIVPPRYDETTNNLVWAVKGSSSAGDIANYDTRILSRSGVMSVKLATDPAQMNAQIPTVQGLLSGFQFKSGQKYAEWRTGEKVAPYGLTALITGGVTVAAAKTGFLQKFAKFIIAGLIALGVAVKAFFTGKKNKK